MMLSSAALATSHGSKGSQLNSDIRLVCPLWINCDQQSFASASPFSRALPFSISSVLTSNSGGPSSISSGVCSSPMCLRSHTLMRLSKLDEARIAGSEGFHDTWCTWSSCSSNEYNFVSILRISNNPTVCSNSPP